MHFQIIWNRVKKNSLKLRQYIVYHLYIQEKKYLRCCYATCLAKNRFVDTFFRRRHFYLPTILLLLLFFFFHQIENSIKYLRTFPTIPHLTPGGNVGGMWGIYFLIFFRYSCSLLDVLSNGVIKLYGGNRGECGGNV